jgi:16S rRNA (uracil1498-N3)-methyltransferase
LRRFYIEEIKVNDKTCMIVGSEAKHITKVLRMTPGDRFILMDSKGSRFEAQIQSTSSRQVSVVLENPLPKQPPSPVKITLCQALPKSRAMDYLIQKTSELGVDRIIPFFSERTVPRFDKEKAANRLRHWHKIAVNAAKQCGRSIPAAIESPISFIELISQWKDSDGQKVIFWKAEGSSDLKSLLKSSLSAKHFVGIVGPEGGFSKPEVQMAVEEGFVAVSLGDRILRAETAAMTMVALVQYELGDLNFNGVRL